VQVIAMAEGSVAREIRGPGTVQSRVPVTVSTRITGLVVSVHADEGDEVRRGRLLAELDDRDLAAKAAVARTERDLARANYERDRAVFEKGYISQAAMDAARATLDAAGANAKAAAAALSYARIHAPMNGVITHREAEAGDTVVPGGALFRIVDPKQLWVVTRVDESVVGSVRVGQAATIVLRSGETLTGKVARVALESDAATREIEVNVSFDTPPVRFAIDQEAEVTIHAGNESGLIAPASALRQQEDGMALLAVVDGRAEQRLVTLGASDGQRVIVRSGIGPGDAVIVSPGTLKSGSRVRPAAGD
jgi:RND family efflux transporter MFP subunit